MGLVPIVWKVERAVRHVTKNCQITRTDISNPRSSIQGVWWW